MTEEVHPTIPDFSLPKATRALGRTVGADLWLGETSRLRGTPRPGWLPSEVWALRRNALMVMEVREDRGATCSWRQPTGCPHLVTSVTRYSEVSQESCGGQWGDVLWSLSRSHQTGNQVQNLQSKHSSQVPGRGETEHWLQPLTSLVFSSNLVKPRDCSGGTCRHLSWLEEEEEEEEEEVGVVRAGHRVLRDGPVRWHFIITTRDFSVTSNLGSSWFHYKTLTIWEALENIWENPRY